MSSSSTVVVPSHASQCLQDIMRAVTWLPSAVMVHLPSVESKIFFNEPAGNSRKMTFRECYTFSIFGDSRFAICLGTPADAGAEEKDIDLLACVSLFTDIGESDRGVGERIAEVIRGRNDHILFTAISPNRILVPLYSRFQSAQHSMPSFLQNIPEDIGDMAPTVLGLMGITLNVAVTSAILPPR